MYGARPAVQVWVNTDSIENVSKIATSLEAAANAHSAQEMKAFVIWTNVKDAPEKALAAEIDSLAKKLKLSKVALTFLDKDAKGAIDDYMINTSDDVKNTVFVYKSKKVKVKFVNLKADDAGLAALGKAITTVTG